MGYTADQLFIWSCSPGVKHQVDVLAAMPKTSAERSWIFRSKLKKDTLKCNEYKNKDKERKRAERSKPQVQSQQEIDRKKKANRDRVRKFRNKKEIHAWECIFFGPIALENAGPFTLPMLAAIEKIFNSTH